MNTKIQCPTCQTTVIWNKESLFRPFCSKQCQLIDLGEWCEENRKIAQQDPDHDDQQIKPQAVIYQFD